MPITDSHFTATTIETALRQTATSRIGDGSAGGLLRELLDGVADDCNSDDGSDGCEVLAAKGRYWSREFGLSIITNECAGTCTVKWGRGEQYTWGALHDVIDGCASGPDFVPKWWDGDWNQTIEA